jgi:hypothetical protein
MKIYKLPTLNENIQITYVKWKYTTMIVYLKTNNLSLCLNHEHLKSVLPNNILK